MSDCNGTCEVCVCKTGTNLKTIHTRASIEANWQSNLLITNYS